MLLYSILPLVKAVVDEPLVTKSNNAFVSSARDNRALWLAIGVCESLINEELSDMLLCNGHLHTLALLYNHDSFIESLKVDSVFCLCKLFFVFLGLDVHLVYKSYRGEVSELWYINDGDRLVWLNPFKLNAIL